MTTYPRQLATDRADARPQPASQSMDKRTALHYQQFTEGQLMAFRHGDGDWYLYALNPVQVEATPLVVQAGRRW